MPPRKRPAAAAGTAAAAAPTGAAAVKAKCMYWDKCYRKNPQHMTDFWHPKDAAEMKRLDDAAAAAAAAAPAPAAAGAADAGAGKKAKKSAADRKADKRARKQRAAARRDAKHSGDGWLLLSDDPTGVHDARLHERLCEEATPTGNGLTYPEMSVDEQNAFRAQFARHRLGYRLPPMPAAAAGDSAARAVNPHGWIRLSRAMDVWVKNDSALGPAGDPAAVSTQAVHLQRHDRLVRDVHALADATSDFFCRSYQNVIDPNLCLSYVQSDAIDALKKRKQQMEESRARYHSKKTDAAAAADAKGKKKAKKHGSDDDEDEDDDEPGDSLPPSLAELHAKAEGNNKAALAAAAGAPIIPRNPQTLKAADVGLPSLDSVDYRWVASDMAVRFVVPAAAAGGGAPFIEAQLTSPIQDIKRAAYPGLYDGVEATFAAAWPRLCELRGWPRNHDDTGDVQGMERTRPDAKETNTNPFTGRPVDANLERDMKAAFDAERKFNETTRWIGAATKPDAKEPAKTVWHDVFDSSLSEYATAAAVDRASAADVVASLPRTDLQVVVKAQKIVVQPGGEYHGAWHEDGMYEHVIAVVVYYHTYPAATPGGDGKDGLVGGAIQFADKRDVQVGEGRRTELLRGWRERYRCTDKVQSGQLLVFSNYQNVHRVLRMSNRTDKPLAREFVCLFVIDPKHRLPSTAFPERVRETLAIGGASAPASAAASAAAASASATGVLPPAIVDLILSYDPQSGYMTPKQRHILRRVLFGDQLKPRSLGLWMMYTTGNGDCQDLAWLAHQQDDGNSDEPVFRGTSSDGLSGAHRRSDDDDDGGGDDVDDDDDDDGDDEDDDKGSDADGDGDDGDDGDDDVIDESKLVGGYGQEWDPIPDTASAAERARILAVRAGISRERRQQMRETRARLKAERKRVSKLKPSHAVALANDKHTEAV